jgi:hypothetical protein
MRLPASVQEIADVIGRERALFLVGQLPRCYVDTVGHQSWRVIMYVPKDLKPDHDLVKMLGWADAMKLVKGFGGEIMQPASCAGIYKTFRDRSALTMLETGMKPVEIAEILGVSDRHVRNLRREKTQEALSAANDNTRAESANRASVMGLNK